MFAIDIQFQSRIVEVLRNQHIVDRTQCVHPGSHGLGESKRFIEVTAPIRISIGAGFPWLTTESTNHPLEISAHFWKVVGEPFAQTLHVSEAAGAYVLLRLT